MINTALGLCSECYRNRIEKIMNWEKFREISEEVMVEQDLGDNMIPPSREERKVTLGDWSQWLKIVQVGHYLTCSWNLERMDCSQNISIYTYVGGRGGGTGATEDEAGKCFQIFIYL